MPERLAFTKMQGIGNDFVLVEARAYPDIDWSSIAPELCNRHTGIGADGLLVIGSCSSEDVEMQMYNPDGSPDVCGNGMRCVARYTVDRGLVHTDSLRIATAAGVRTARAHRGNSGAVISVTVSMGSPLFDPRSIPMLLTAAEVHDYPLDLGAGECLTISALSTGSTHAVTFVEELPGDDLFFKVSPRVELHPLFPERTSLMWCKVVDRTHIAMRIWERAAGETLGCGTGACAAAVAGVRLGLVPAGQSITVASKGGELLVTWQPGEEIQMQGPAEYVFEGVYNSQP